MKTFNRCNMPDSITYNKRKYTFLGAALARRKTTLAFCEEKGYKLIQVDVLSKNLRGVTDLHGQLYKPSQFFFCSPEMPQAEMDLLAYRIKEGVLFLRETAEYKGAMEILNRK